MKNYGVGVTFKRWFFKENKDGMSWAEILTIMYTATMLGGIVGSLLIRMSRLG